MNLNYHSTFIAVAEDCPAIGGLIPPRRDGRVSAADVQYRMLVEQPYAHSQPDILFESATVGRESASLSPDERTIVRAEFFARPLACLRTSPLAKRYGWGIHFNAEGRAAAYAVDSPDYQRLRTDPDLAQTRAMRSKRG